MKVHTYGVREADGECSWESCDHGATAWMVCTTHTDEPWLDRSWVYKRPEDAAKAALDLLSGHIQPLKLTGFARLSKRTVYLP